MPGLLSIHCRWSQARLVARRRLILRKPWRLLPGLSWVLGTLRLLLLPRLGKTRDYVVHVGGRLGFSWLGLGRIIR